MPRIAHLSDPHLDGGPERARRLERVLDEVAVVADIDLVIMSGDVADAGDARSYAQFIDVFRPAQPTVVVPGNHDLRAPMASAFGADENGLLNSVATVDGLTVIGLDSLVEGDPGGRLSDDTLAFADVTVRAAEGVVVLTLHHPPVPVDHELMDGYGLYNATALAELVAGHETVAGVLTGHAHRGLATTFVGRPLLSAPGIVSTMRLGSRTDPIADDRATPGFALHTVHPDGSLSTIFHHLSPESVTQSDVSG